MKKFVFIAYLVFISLSSIGQTGNVSGFNVEAIDTFKLNKEVFVLNTNNMFDGQVIKRVGGVWKNDTTGTTGAAIDSLSWSYSNGYFHWWVSGSKKDSLSLDLRYVMYSDSSSVFITPAQLDEYFTDAKKTVYSIHLPAATNISTRIAGAVEGVDYPTGWVLTEGASSVDINILHNLDRRVASVSVFALVTGTEEQQLFNTAAYNGIITPDSNSLRVQSLATINKPIIIYITFE